MSDVLIDQNTMEDIGDSIRSKLGVQTTYLPSEMPSAIMSISGGGGGGSAKYSETVLWSGTQSTTGTITLSESVKNFSIIMLMISAHPDNTNYYKTPWYILVSEITDYTTKYQFEPFGVRGANNVNNRACMLSLHFTSETSILIDEADYGSQAKPTLLKVIGIKWETIQTALIYSTEEREVGVWTDGKPLYQKTINCGLVANDTSAHDIAHNISNIEKCISCNALLTKNDEEHFANAYRPTQTIGILVWRSGANIRYINNWLGANEYRLYVTLQYTKTTDTPGSGIWTTTGEYAHHYSTDEHIIGTWIDGKTLYERTIDFGALPLTATKTLAHNIANVDNIWVYDGFVYSTGGLFYQLNRTTNNSTYQWETTVDRTNVTMQDFAAFGNDHSAIITVRYTKTT